MRISSCGLFSDASKSEDPVRLPPSLQSLGNPGTSYSEQRKFPLIAGVNERARYENDHMEASTEVLRSGEPVPRRNSHRVLHRYKLGSIELN